MATEQELTNNVIKKWQGKRGALTMALHDVQGIYGYVPWEVAQQVGQGLGVPVARIYEVLTFYNFFKLESPGKYIISACDGTACHIKGSSEVLAALEKELGITAGQTTEDGLFHLQIVRCLGCCGLAPVIVINGKTYRTVSSAQVPQIIQEWKDKGAE